MTDLVDIKTHLPTRVGLSSHAIFRLWKTALKDDETLLDEAIASVHEQMTSLDQARAEQRDYFQKPKCPAPIADVEADVV